MLFTWLFAADSSTRTKYSAMKFLLLCCVVVTVSATRMTRDRPPECLGPRPTVRPSDCCIGSDVLHSAELTDCKADYPDESGDASGRSNLRRNPCIMDCYFNKTGIFKDGEPVKAVALDVLGKAADADITALLNDGIDKCIEIQKNVKSKMKESAAKFPLPPMPDDSDRKRCRPDAKMFSMCVQAYIFSHCPVEKLVSSAECAQLSQFHQKCMPQLPK